VWQGFFDVVFSVSSILLAIFLGAGARQRNSRRPVDASGYFFEPLWTNFRLGHRPAFWTGTTVMAGVVALVTLTAHGSYYVAIKTARIFPAGRAYRAALWPLQFFLLVSAWSRPISCVPG